MYRASFRLPKKVLLSTSVAASGVAIHEREKLSIYPAPTPEIVLQETPSDLEKQIGVARRQVTEVIRNGHSQVQGLVNKWIGIEHAIENRVKSIISPKEPLTPGILYVGVAGLSGSILARGRMLPTRLLLPPILLIASAKHFLPQTTSNLSEYLASLEETYFPTLAEKHDIANAHTRMTIERVKEATQDSRAWARKSALSVVETIQEHTGLKVKEAMGFAKQERVKVEEKAHEVAVKVEEKAREVAAKVETKAHEAVEKVEAKSAQVQEKVKEVVQKTEEKVKEAAPQEAPAAPAPEPAKKPEENKRLV